MTRKKENISGWLNVYKPYGMTSMQATAKARWLLNAAKAGHAGTLDPLATGVLPIAFGEATKLIPLLHAVEQEQNKTYRFTVQWGTQTSTDDAEGQIIATSPHRPTREQIESALKDFTGTITQVPPAFSAIKVNGQRAYAAARKGEDVTIPPRQITITSFRLLETMDDDSILSGADESTSSPFILSKDKGGGRPPLYQGVALPTPSLDSHNASEGREARLPENKAGNSTNHSHFEVICQTGTYIRALARDLALFLGTVGHCTRIIRTKVGAFEAKDTILLDSLEQMPYESRLTILRPLAFGLDDIPALAITETEAQDLRRGQGVSFLSLTNASRLPQPAPAGPLLAMHGDRLIAVCRFEGGVLRPVRVMNHS